MSERCETCHGTGVVRRQVEWMGMRAWEVYECQDCDGESRDDYCGEHEPRKEPDDASQ
jgi:DnaJ-class molecular chaperone